MWLTMWFVAGTAIAMLASPPPAYAQADNEPVGIDSRDSGPHEHYHDFYKDWRQPDGSSCCNANQYYDEEKLVHMLGDCEPTEAELRATGERRNGRQVVQWWARLPKYLGGEWVPIPDERVIKQINPEPSKAHLCYNYGRVLCFVPPFGGF
jgi:hypothetical protein